MGEQTDAFPCAVGSDAPAKVILSYDPKVRCPLCHHLAVSHSAESGGTCDICNAVRIAVNSLVMSLGSHGIDLTSASPQVEQAELAVDEMEQEQAVSDRPAT